MINGIPFYVAYLTPIIFIVAVNFIVMIITFVKLFQKSAAATKQNQLEASQRLRIVFSCSVLMGVTWILGAFAIGELTFTFQLLFTIFNSLQGLFIFVFYCALNKDAVKEWKRVFGCKASEAVTSTGKTSQGSVKKRKKSKSHVSTATENGSRDAKKVSVSEVGEDILLKINGERKGSKDIASLEEVQVHEENVGKFLVNVCESDETEGIEMFHIEIENPESIKEDKIDDQEENEKEASPLKEAVEQQQGSEERCSSIDIETEQGRERGELELNGDSCDNQGFNLESKGPVDPIDMKDFTIEEQDTKQKEKDDFGSENLGFNKEARDEPEGVAIAGNKFVEMKTSEGEKVEADDDNIDLPTGLSKDGEADVGGNATAEAVDSAKEIKKEFTSGKINRERSKTEKRVFRGTWNFQS